MGEKHSGGRRTKHTGKVRRAAQVPGQPNRFRMCVRGGPLLRASRARSLRQSLVLSASLGASVSLVRRTLHWWPVVQRWARQTTQQTITAMLVLSAAAVLLTGCSPFFASGRAQVTPTGSGPAATATPTPIPYPTPPELGSLVPGPLPSGCATTTLQLHSISPYIAPAFGSGPVWVVGMKSVFSLPMLGETPDPRYGWAWKLIWEVGPSYDQVVTVHGVDERTGAPLWFNPTPEAPNTVAMMLDPRQPGHPESKVGEDWREWGSYMYIPGAGCYELEADWPGGHWRIMFAAGA